MNRESDRKEHELDIISSKIRQVHYDQPGPELLSGVMGRVAPKKRTLRSRFRLWLANSGNFAVWPKMVPVVAACAVLIMFFAFRQAEVPVPGTGVQVADNSNAPTVGEVLVQADASAVSEGVRFRLALPQAESVALVGSFNDWQPEGFTMYKDEDQGVWVITVPIENGRHKYNFLVDGKELIPDPGAVVNEPDGFGNFNSVLYVDAGHENSI